MVWSASAGCTITLHKLLTYCPLHTATCVVHVTALRPAFSLLRARNWSTSLSLSIQKINRSDYLKEVQHVLPCFFFSLSFVLFFSALGHCFWLADPTQNIEKKRWLPKLKRMIVEVILTVYEVICQSLGIWVHFYKPQTLHCAPKVSWKAMRFKSNIVMSMSTAASWHIPTQLYIRNWMNSSMNFQLCPTVGCQAIALLSA